MADKFVTVSTYPTPHEAHLAKMQLESADIPAVVCDEMTVGMVWHMGPALGGVRVQVAEADAERALAILSGAELIEKVDHPAEATPYRKPGRDEKEKELQEIVPTHAADEAARRAFRAAIIGLVLCPGVLHLYSVGLLLSLHNSKSPLGPWGRRNYRSALVLDVAVLTAIAVLAILKL